ncbi:GMC oxidoreductase [Methylohalobius crimeensis]|uniref:GMC oxidoreductase n=1 Tax=Methylohalobius crimeensis TaxID=244365 RepID=UPI0003B634F2|nr:GMC family oxidoreductase [Methylohalobius crimeensis]
MIEDIVNKHWDVVVVGTGMGGATIGYALAKAGKSVLFCEKGKSPWSSTGLKGRYAEDYIGTLSPNLSRNNIFKDAGREWTEIEDRTKRRIKAFTPFVGSGSGGSTALYGMALERFFPGDFTPGACYPEAGASTLPKRWPIAYEDLLPYYAEAERLYRVRGTPDALRGKDFHPPYLEPPPLSEGGGELFSFLREQGCHPYRLPSACEYRPDCNCCQGYLCARECKNDSNRICLQPALSRYGATLLDDCEILRLEATHHKVTGVICRRASQTIRLKGSIIILAAGALFSPKILLQSVSDEWPHGLANHSGLVGKNLMRHYIDLYVLRPKTGVAVKTAWKELAFSDYYFEGGRKYGSVQGFGALPPAPQLVESLAQELRQGPFPIAEFLFRPMKPLVRKYLDARLSRSVILASMVEDLPYQDNRVEVEANGRLHFYYRMRPVEKERVKQMRSHMRRLLKPYRPMLIKQAENNERLAHACGTCRFGINASDSVLNGDNRAHGLENLYVVDASFFPSSAGINPSLTIAANALRVAHKITVKHAFEN